MKRVLLAITGMVLLSSALFAQTPGDTEALVSADVHAFIKTTSIGKVIKTVNFIVNNLMDEQTRSQTLAGRDQFRDKTGIDMLNEASLKKNGIDTSRPLSLAVYPDVNSQQVILVFVPIINEKEFPARFYEILKKTSDDPANLPTTLKATYKGVAIYQMQSDLFTAAFNGYFLMGSTAEVVKKAIDLKSQNTDSLVLDQNYKDYLAGRKDGYDINIYMSKQFIASLNKSNTGTPYSSGEQRDGLVLTQYGETDGTYGGEEGGYGAPDGGDTGIANAETYVDVVDYIAIGIGLDGRRVKMNGMVKLIKGNPDMELLLGVFQTGIIKNTLNVGSADSAMSWGINLKKIEDFCKNGNPACNDYTQFKMQFNQATGIDYDKEFLPYFAGVINVIALDTGAANGAGDMVVYIPFTDAKKTEVIWNKLKKMTQQQYGPQKMFGEEKLDGKKAFWFTDQTQVKYYITYDARGIYVGNSTKLLKTAMKSGTMDKSRPSGALGTLVSEKTFMFIDIKKNAMLQQMLTMYSGNPMMGGILAGMGEIIIQCEKTSDGFSVDLEMELKGK